MKKRNWLFAVALVALGAMIAMPASASAKKHHHKRHKRHLRHLQAPSDSAELGTIASFDGTTLVITTASGDVSGTVTGRTRVEYYTGDDDSSYRIGPGAPPPGGPGTTSQEAPEGAPPPGGCHHDGGSAGSVDDLVPGTTVHEAYARVTPGGLEFLKIEIVASS